jgi:hypothetical protein
MSHGSYTLRDALRSLRSVVDILTDTSSPALQIARQNRHIACLGLVHFASPVSSEEPVKSEEVAYEIQVVIQ